MFPNDETEQDEQVANGQIEEQEPETASGEHDVAKLPRWAQDLLKKQGDILADLKDENAKRRIAAKTAEMQQLEEQGKWQEVAKQYGEELAAIRTQMREQTRLAVANKVTRDVLGGLVDDYDEFAKLLNGETEDELRAHANRLKSGMAKRPLPNTEGAGGRGRPAPPPAMTPEQLAASLKKEGTYNAL